MVRKKKSPFFGPRGVSNCCSNVKGCGGTLLTKPIHDPPVGCGHSGPSRHPTQRNRAQGGRGFVVLSSFLFKACESGFRSPSEVWH